MSITYPFKCTVNVEHFGFTYDASHVCSVHRQSLVNSLAELPKETLELEWNSFKGLTHSSFVGIPSPEMFSSMVFSTLRDVIASAVHAIIRERIGSLDIADAHARYVKAWTLREDITGRLFPVYFDDLQEVTKVLSLKAENADGKSDLAQTIISYLVTLAWKIKIASGGNLSANGSPVNPNDAISYIEWLGNVSIADYTYRVVGEAYYSHVWWTKEATGANPANSSRYHESLIRVPQTEAFQRAEAEYQAQLNKITQAQKAAQVQANRQTAAKARAVASGIGSLIENADRNSQRRADDSKRRDRERADAKFRADRDYNARIWAERNRRAEDKRNRWF